MVVRVDGKYYVVQRPHGSKANVRLADGSNHQCKRIYRPGTHRLETDLEMQTRVQELVTELNAEQERAQPLSARLTLGSPALSASASIILTTEVECADAGDRRQTASAAAEAVALQALAALGRQLRPHAQRGAQGCEGRPRLHARPCRVSRPATGWPWERLADALEASRPLRGSGRRGGRCRASTGHCPAGRAGAGPRPRQSPRPRPRPPSPTITPQGPRALPSLLPASRRLVGWEC